MAVILDAISNDNEEYAFKEIWQLVRQIKKIDGDYLDQNCPTFRYVCALFSEIAYHHIPQWEVDTRKRGKLHRLPSVGYRALLDNNKGLGNNAGAALSSVDLIKPIIATTSGAVAVGHIIDDYLFIGIRGTAFLFDWRVNIRADLVTVDSGRKIVAYDHGSTFRIRELRPDAGKLHSGFAEEAIRISNRLLAAIPEGDHDKIKQVILTGHSLGGAVAAISTRLFSKWPAIACIFGAPRYADVASYLASNGDYPVQIRRPGDVIPTVPPRSFGYVDHPNEYTTAGGEYVDVNLKSWIINDTYRWAKFLGSCFKPHSMEIYRVETGIAANAKWARHPLTDAVKLALTDIY